MTALYPLSSLTLSPAARLSIVCLDMFGRLGAIEMAEVHEGLLNNFSIMAASESASTQFLHKCRAMNTRALSAQLTSCFPATPRDTVTLRQSRDERRNLTTEERHRTDSGSSRPHPTLATPCSKPPISKHDECDIVIGADCPGKRILQKLASCDRAALLSSSRVQTMVTTFLPVCQG